MSIDDNILEKDSKGKSVMLKALSAEINVLEKTVNACDENLQSYVGFIRNTVVSLKNTYVLNMTTLLNNEQTDEQKIQELLTNTSIIEASFDHFISSIADHLAIIATNTTDDADIEIAFYHIANLKGCDDKGDVIALNGTEIDPILINFKAGVKSQKEQNIAIEKRDNCKKKYNDILYGEE